MSSRLDLVLILARAVILRSESRWTHAHNLLSQIPDSPQPGEPGPLIYIPQNQGGLDIPPGIGLTGLRLRYSTAPPHVTLQLTVSRSWCRAPSGAHDQVFIAVWQLQSFSLWGALSEERTGLSLYMLLALASAIFLGSEPLFSHNYSYINTWDHDLSTGNNRKIYSNKFDTVCRNPNLRQKRKWKLNASSTSLYVSLQGNSPTRPVRKSLLLFRKRILTASMITSSVYNFRASSLTQHLSGRRVSKHFYKAVCLFHFRAARRRELEGPDNGCRVQGPVLHRRPSAMESKQYVRHW
jgi:hypothetical protein